MTRKRNRDNEIVCMCSAYDHPHRLGGGACNGSEWCASIRVIDSYDCQNCNRNNHGECDVVTGQDRLDSEHCECVANELRTGYLADEFGYLPLDVDQYMLKKERDYYDHR